MKARDFDPLRLDVGAFAKEGERLEGEWPLSALDRLASAALPDSVADSAPITWELSGETRGSQGGQSQVWLHLHARAQVTLECQRCLKPMTEALEAQRSFLFVHGEDAAAALDAESEDDVLALSRALDARELLEDELLLSLPIVPRHETCPEPLVVEDATLPEDDTPHPFAKLAALKRGGLPN